MRGDIYHICNLSPKVIFRSEEDFLMAINKLAICSFVCNVDILAFSIMSTHFHIVVMGTEEDVRKFLSLISKILACRYRQHYGKSLKINFSTRKINENMYDLITCINYVLKNGLHHGVVGYPFVYPYSSIGCYFYEELRRQEYFKGENANIYQTYLKPSDLSLRDKRALFGSFNAPETFRILFNRIVIPESFVNVRLVEQIYSTPKNFMYNMMKPLKEEIEMFGTDQTLINDRFSKVNLAGTLSDLQVCEIIDCSIYPRSFTSLSKMEISNLWEKLLRQGVSKFQFERCI